MMKPLFGSFVLLLMCAALSFAGLSEKDKAQGLQKTSSNDLYRPFLINNVFNYYSNNGDGSFNKFSTDNEGFEIYKGDGKNAIFEDGVVWGGYHKGRAIPKVGGSVYRHALQAGPILTNGTLTTDPVAAASDDPAYRIYRVRPDINPSIPFSDLEGKIKSEEVNIIGRFESYTAQQIYDQYIKDWNEWPAALGAPYKDVDSNGVYNPAKDIPGQPGSDQTLWYVSNDCSQARVTLLSGSPLIGLEMQRTIWGYKRSGALGQVIFQSTLLVNKSGAPIDTMYLVQWSDPDLGDAGDDYVGCDSARSLGYVYNSKSPDATFGDAVPAAGFDFFQGPLVASAADSAIFKLKFRKGFKNLPMSAFVFFTQGNPTYADPLQGVGGDVEWYRLMKGTVAKTGTDFINPITGKKTLFTLSGDPVLGTGWLDGNPATAADRRMCMVTGPFTMAPGDTQELVVAAMAGVGADRLSSVSDLKTVSDKAQSAYNSLFKLAAPPPSPDVKIAQMDGEVILSWGDPAGIAKTEGTVDKGFAFEGYNLYELRGGSAQNPILLGTFDLVNGIKTLTDTIRDAGTGLNMIQVLQRGTDNGLVRSLDVKTSKVTGASLVNGTRYFFGITAFSFNQDPPAADGTHSLESPIQVITVVPQSPNPGTRYTSKGGDSVKVTLTTAAGAPASDGSVVALVVDPTRVTGDGYKVTFGSDPTLGSVWSLTNTTSNKVLVNKATNQTGDDDYAITEGLKVKVIGPAPGMKEWSAPAPGLRRFSPVGGALFGLEGFSNAGAPTAPQDRNAGTIGMGQNFAFGSITTSLPPTGYHDVQIRWAAVPALPGLWDPLATPTDVNYSLAYRYVRSAANPPAKPEFAPWITNPLGNAGYAYQGYNYSVPFSVWDMSTTPPTRLAVGHLENNQPNGLVDGRYFPALTTVDNGDAAGPREFLFIFATPYTATPDPQYTINFLGSHTPLMWVATCARRNDPPYTNADIFNIVANKVNTPSHTYTFASAKPTIGDLALAKQDVGKVNVFPNPYLGFNPQEINRYARFVTFNHLPKKATLRIFNLAGILVRTMQKDEDSQFFQWDLNNDSGFPVSAGMYIVYIDMPDLGVTKTLKLGVVPEQQYLDRW
jgi:hypothetical protein